LVYVPAGIAENDEATLFSSSCTVYGRRKMLITEDARFKSDVSYGNTKQIEKKS
jgi:UDP-glucose 4-epimerase